MPAGHGLPEEARERLRASWASVFHERVFPILLACESDFAALYASEKGRPSWSIARRLGICLLQEMFDLSDQHALDALSFDARWQFALGLEPGESYLSRRSLVDFRSRLVRLDPEMQLLHRLFEHLRDAQIEDLRLSTELQRMDSTFVVSNICRRGRTGLFGRTLELFLRDLQRNREDAFGTLSESLRAWSAERAEKRGWFGDNGPASLLQTLAEWLVEVWLRFRDDDDVSSWESFELIVRLVQEQLKVVEPGKDEGGGDKTPPAYEPGPVRLRRPEPHRRLSAGPCPGQSHLDGASAIGRADHPKPRIGGDQDRSACRPSWSPSTTSPTRAWRAHGATRCGTSWS